MHACITWLAIQVQFIGESCKFKLVDIDTAKLNVKGY